jgi:hypothetical protein
MQRMRPINAGSRRGPRPPDRPSLDDLDLGDKTVSHAIRRARRILGLDIPLLIQGETGTGKEVFAQAFHTSGPRRNGPFVAINCAAIPANLIEAELFGYTAGAYTGGEGAAASCAKPTGHPVPRRNRRHAPRCRPSCCASSKPAGSRRWAAARRKRSTCPWSAPATAP